MYKVYEILDCIREMAPESLAEPWDNSGLLISSGVKQIDGAIVCLDVTRRVIDAAINSGKKLIISHHPFIFNPLKRISVETEQGELLREIIKNDISIYAAHTNVDKAYGGLNDLLAGIVGIEVDYPENDNSAPSYYRIGKLSHEMKANDFYEYVRLRLKLKSINVVNCVNNNARSKQMDNNNGGDMERDYIKNAAVMCGAYDREAEGIIAARADALLCGEIRYHESLDLAGMGVHILQAGHFETELFFMNLIEKWIKEKFPDFTVNSIGYTEPPIRTYTGK